MGARPAAAGSPAVWYQTAEIQRADMPFANNGRRFGSPDHALSAPQARTAIYRRRGYRLRRTSGPCSRGVVSEGDCPRPEIVAIHELELDALAQTGEQRRPVSGKDWLHKEHVLVDQS